VHIPELFLIWESAEDTELGVDREVRTWIELTATGEAMVGRMSLQREADDGGLSANAAASSSEDRMR
jgi:hypothetical protein